MLGVLNTFLIWSLFIFPGSTGSFSDAAGSVFDVHTYLQQKDLDLIKNGRKEKKKDDRKHSGLQENNVLTFLGKLSDLSQNPNLLLNLQLLSDRNVSARSCLSLYCHPIGSPGHSSQSKSFKTTTTKKKTFQIHFNKLDAVLMCSDNP